MKQKFILAFAGLLLTVVIIQFVAPDGEDYFEFEQLTDEQEQLANNYREAVLEALSKKGDEREEALRGLHKNGLKNYANNPNAFRNAGYEFGFPLLRPVSITKGRGYKGTPNGSAGHGAIDYRTSWSRYNEFRSKKVQDKYMINGNHLPALREKECYMANSTLEEFIDNNKPESPVLSIGQGVVIVARKENEGDHSGGNYCVVMYVREGKPVVYARYLHMQNIFVEEGTTVNMFDCIGIEGCTGDVRTTNTSDKGPWGTGKHLHLEIYEDTSSGLRSFKQTDTNNKNPALYIGEIDESGDTPNVDDYTSGKDTVANEKMLNNTETAKAPQPKSSFTSDKWEEIKGIDISTPGARNIAEVDDEEDDEAGAIEYLKKLVGHRAVKAANTTGRIGDRPHVWGISGITPATLGILMDRGNGFAKNVIDDYVAKLPDIHTAFPKSDNYTVNLSKSGTESKLHPEAVSSLEAMAKAYKADLGVPLYLSSISRDYQNQIGKYSNPATKTKITTTNTTEGYGDLKAFPNVYSFATPGGSEHHTGMALDFVEPSSSKMNKKAGKGYENASMEWLRKNAWKFGWVQSYPAGKEEEQGVIEEAWHYRYVGKKLAYYLTKNNWTLAELYWRAQGKPAPGLTKWGLKNEKRELTTNFKAQEDVEK